MDSLSSMNGTSGAYSSNAAAAVAALAPNNNDRNTVHVTTDGLSADQTLSPPQSPLAGRASRGCWPWSRETKYKIAGVLLAVAAITALIYSGVVYHTDFKDWFQQQSGGIVTGIALAALGGLGYLLYIYRHKFEELWNGDMKNTFRTIVIGILAIAVIVSVAAILNHGGSFDSSNALVKEGFSEYQGLILGFGLGAGAVLGLKYLIPALYRKWQERNQRLELNIPANESDRNAPTLSPTGRSNCRDHGGEAPIPASQPSSAVVGSAEAVPASAIAEANNAPLLTTQPVVGTSAPNPVPPSDPNSNALS